MAYQNYIDQAIQTVYENGVAKKILQHMDFIRNRSDMQQARRWGMELLQNARDVAYPDQGVRIEITYAKDTLTFAHNGKPFRVKDILSLINQVSSKLSSDKDTVGQFGTGFLSTYQLSPVVMVSAVLADKDPDGEVDMLPYIPFEIPLDRSGKDEQDILEGVHQAMELLRQVDSRPPLEKFEKNAYNTKFTYRIQGEFGYQAMRYGIQDMASTMLYILLFSERIDSVTLTEKQKGSRLYQRAERTEIGDGVWAQRFCVTSTDESGQVTIHWHTIHYMEEQGIWIAAEWAEDRGYLPVPEQAARIYVDFPLVGSQSFPFPVCCNSRRLHPNEPRSGITLVDHEASLDAQENKQIMLRACALYKRFLKAAAARREQGISNLLAIPELHSDPELSEAWVKEKLYDDIYSFFREQPILQAGESWYCLADPEMYFVKGETERECELVKALLAPLEGIIYPTDGQDWLGALLYYPIEADKVISLEALLKNPTWYLSRHGSQGDEEAQLAWLGELLTAGMENEELARQIKASEIAIFPNQKTPMTEKLFPINALQREHDIPEILKDVAEVLAQLRKTDEIAGDLRRHLLHQGFRHPYDTLIAPYEKSELFQFIERRSNRKFLVQNFHLYAQTYEAIWEKAWVMMLSCGPSEELYQVYAQYNHDIPAYQPIGEEWDAALWRNSIQGILNILATYMSEKKNLSALVEAIGLDAESTFQWYALILYLTERYCAYNLDTYAVVANQEGIFCRMSDLQMDQIQDEALKKIAPLIAPNNSSYQIKVYLMDTRITFEKPMMRTMSKHILANMIESAVRNIMREGSLHLQEESIQLACSMLLEWIRKNEVQAKTMFPDYCGEQERMQLLTPTMAARLQSKADIFDDILKTAGVQSPEQLAEFIKNSKGNQMLPEVRRILGDEYADLSPNEQQALLEEIGLAGERYAPIYLIEKYQDCGYILEAEEPCRWMLTNGQERIEIYYPDGAGAGHQPGWDVRVTHQNTGTAAYYEVKTHTPTSMYADEIRLSAEQMRYAMRLGVNYTVLLMDYAVHQKKIMRVRAFPNLIGQMAAGSLVGREGYCMFVQEK